MSNNHDDHGFAHPVSVKLLLAVFCALIFLTVLTVATAGNVPQPFGIWISMGIATIKASLVMLFFMHMFWEKGFNVLVFFSSFFFAALFISLTLMDTGHNMDSIDRFPREAETQAK